MNATTIITALDAGLDAARRETAALWIAEQDIFSSQPFDFDQALNDARAFEADAWIAGH